MGGASFGTQANALLRKSAVYQKRNVCTNICLLSSPIFFCFILLAIKIVVDKLLLGQEDFKCGCACEICCMSGNCSIPDPYCKMGNCEQYSSTNCGVQYSTPIQAEWCEVRSPSAWPPLLHSPKKDVRALPARPALTTLMTAPQSPSFTFSQLYPNVYTTPSGLDNVTLLNYLIPNLVENFTYNTYLLSKYGFSFATDTQTGSQYTEKAFSIFQIPQMLVPVTKTMSCANFSSIFPPFRNVTASTAVPMVNVLSGIVNLTSNTTVSPAQIMAVATAKGDPIIMQTFMRQSVACVNVVFSDEATYADIDETLYCGFQQARCNGTSTFNEYPTAYEYVNASRDSLVLNLYYNGTDNRPDDGSGREFYQRWNMGFSAAVTSWLNATLGGNTVAANAARLLGLMAMPKAASRLKLDLSTLLGPLFYTWVVQMLLPTFLQLLVYEKEKRLRMMMKMHGLGDGAYWLVTYLWYLMLYVIYMAIFIIFGAAVGLEIFRRTSMGMQIIFYFLFGNNMIAMSFMLSSLFTSARTSIAVAFIYIFATGLLGQLLLRIFMEQNRSWVFFAQWIPAFSLYRGLWEMSQYAVVGVYRGTPGLNFTNWTEPGCGMRATWGIFVVEWVIFMVLGWYLEQVVSNGTGIRRHPLYFLSCCMPKKKNAGSLVARASLEMANPPGGSAAAAGPGGSVPLSKDGSMKLQPGEREDVRAERLRVEAMTDSEQVPPIMVRDLRKVFPAQDGGKPKVAVRTLTLAIERGECFGLLGPNGAGKSTSINMLTGFLEPTSGTAYIEGMDITTEMSKIYRQMGVCPQHDLLWEQLTGEEHLYFYGRLKGLKGSDLDECVTKALKGVNLLNGGVGRKLSGKYSGGMKRRLSVAISFIGDPQVVYLDEPSTGLDPASRRALWDVVRSNKDGRAVILTTHSMEEAEILCDRLGIFVDGQLVCVGAPREITARYAGYLVFTLTVGPGHENAAKAFVQHISPNSRLTYELGSTFKYELPTADVSLAGVFAAMATAKTKMQVLDWGVANATLEEVFIKFAREIGAETRDQ